ncbi:hypothetical protein FRC05_009821 [Tulasnella sp. 425]|nr:hypothetical protein FRC05_009821 [Tulasnella sp. 425]
MDHPSFDGKATGTAIDQSQWRKLPIDTLPIELLERVIRIAATKFTGPRIEWICAWRLVSRKWASVIDQCSALWSYIVVSSSAGHLPTQLAKSKGAPLTIRLSFFYTHKDEEWIRLLVDNVHRWKAITFDSHLEEVSAMLDSPPPMLEALDIGETTVPRDSKFFGPSSPNLRVLKLTGLTIPSNHIQPIFGLKKLTLSCIKEVLGDGTYAPISARKLHQFLEASPGLQVLKVAGYWSSSAADKSLQPVNLPNLEELGAYGAPVLHLFRAEHCADLTVILDSVKNKLPPGSWTTVIPILRRARGLEVDVSRSSVRISSLLEPPTVHLRIHMELEEEDADHLSSAILEEILQELETESCISARIQLSLHPSPRYDSSDIGIKVLKLLQSPMLGHSSRWRLPHLDTICIRGEGFPYQYLQAFVQARANAQGDEASKAVTSILERDAYGSGGKEILGEVMGYTSPTNKPTSRCTKLFNVKPPSQLINPVLDGAPLQPTTTWHPGHARRPSLTPPTPSCSPTPTSSPPQIISRQSSAHRLRAVHSGGGLAISAARQSILSSGGDTPTAFAARIRFQRQESIIPSMTMSPRGSAPVSGAVSGANKNLIPMRTVRKQPDVEYLTAQSTPIRQVLAEAAGYIPPVNASSDSIATPPPDSPPSSSASSPTNPFPHSFFRFSPHSYPRVIYPKSTPSSTPSSTPTPQQQAAASQKGPIIVLPVPDPQSFPLLIHYMYHGKMDAIERTLREGQVSWEGLVRNVEYLGLRDDVKRYLASGGRIGGTRKRGGREGVPLRLLRTIRRTKIRRG